MKKWVPAVLFLILFTSALGSTVYFWLKAEANAKQLSAARAEVASLRAQPRPVARRTLEMPVAPVPTVSSDQLARIQMLEAQLAEKSRLLEAQQAVVLPVEEPAATNTPPERPRSWRDRESWMNELKETDPQRYEEIMARREESRKKMHDAFAQKAAHFLNRDTANMPEEERVEYQHMLELLDTTWRMAEKLQADDVPREDRREAMRSIRETMPELIPLLDAERDREFYDLGVGFGYNSEEAIQFVDYMNELIDITSMRPVFESMHGGGGGPRTGGR